MQSALALQQREAVATPDAATRRGLTPTQIALIRTSFEILAAERDRFAEMFYARAIAIDPQVRRQLLPSNMVVQRLQLLLTLSEIVRQLDDLPRLSQTVTALSRRHDLFGAGDPRFQAAQAALLWAVDRILTPSPDGSLQTAWNQACALVGSLLCGGIPGQR